MFLFIVYVGRSKNKRCKTKQQNKPDDTLRGKYKDDQNQKIQGNEHN